MKKRNLTATEFFAEQTAITFATLGVAILIWCLGSIIGFDDAGIYWRSEKILNAKAHAVDRCNSGTTAKKVDCTFSVLEQSVDRLHEKADLIAQQRAAGGALIGGITGAITLFISAVGLIYVSGTLRETRAANRRGMREFARARIEARKASDTAAASLRASEAAAKAAKDQVRIAEDMAKRQLRAYLATEEARIFDVSDSEIWIELSISNKGSTPARLSDIKNCIWSGPITTPNPSKKGPPIKSRNSPIKLIGHGSAQKILFWIDDFDPESIGKNKNDVYFYGRINYIDVFNDKHWIDFCYNLKGYVAMIDDEMKKCESGNDSSI